MVYSIFKEVKYESELYTDQYCDSVCYRVAFWSISITWVIGLIIFFILFGIICYAIGVSSFLICTSTEKEIRKLKKKNEQNNINKAALDTREIEKFFYDWKTQFIYVINSKWVFQDIEPQEIKLTIISSNII